MAGKDHHGGAGQKGRLEGDELTSARVVVAMARDVSVMPDYLDGRWCACVERMRGKEIPCEVIYDGFGWFDKLVVYYNVRLCVGLNRARSRHIILQLAVYTRVGGERWIQRRAEESAQLPGLSKTSAVYDGIE